MIWKLLITLFVYAMMHHAYAEQIPDYNNPYAPIYTDKEVYTWTDKMKITIVAPSWNENVHTDLPKLLQVAAYLQEK